MSAGVDIGTWGPVVLAAGQVQTWWFTWGFDSNHYVCFDACPDSDQSQVQILAQWAEKNISGGVTRLVTFKNTGSTPVQFRPRCILAPGR